jgi:hypothetical protein
MALLEVSPGDVRPVGTVGARVSAPHQNNTNIEPLYLQISDIHQNHVSTSCIDKNILCLQQFTWIYIGTTVAMHWYYPLQETRPDN